MTDSLLDYVQAHLQDRKGQWNEIAKATGLPMSTVQRLAHGQTPNPGIKTVEKLARYFRERTAELERLKHPDQPAA